MRGWRKAGRCGDGMPCAMGLFRDFEADAGGGEYVGYRPSKRQRPAPQQKASNPSRRKSTGTQG